MIARLLKLRTSPAAEQPRLMLLPATEGTDDEVYRAFWKNVRERRPQRVLEAGTRRSSDDRSTHNIESFPWVERQDYVCLDIRDGIDVDIIGDLHALPSDWTGRFDCFLADAVFEHLERPWIAAREISRVLSPGAPFLIVTHQTYPLHGHPNDFFRFSREALTILLEDAGLVVDKIEYAERCLVVPPEHIVSYDMLGAWNRLYPSYALVRATGWKP